MKTSLVFFLFMLISIAVYAQDTDPQNREFSLKIVDNRGRPLNKIIVQSLNTGKSGMTDRAGLFLFGDISDNDTISMRLPKYGQTLIPVAGLDSIVVTIRSKKLYSYDTNTGESVIIEKETLEPGSLLNVPELLRQRPCNSLMELLQGQVAGLNISTGGSSNGEAATNIRGMQSPTSSSEPLVVLDGMPVGTLNEANRAVNVYSIQSIEVLKSASEWGILGANGVILIKTK